jgi:hypothetical protein
VTYNRYPKEVTDRSARVNAQVYVVRGLYLPSGGKADVYLDGKFDGTVDVFADEAGVKGGEDVWHAFGLGKQRHKIRVVVDDRLAGNGTSMRAPIPRSP